MTGGVHAHDTAKPSGDTATTGAHHHPHPHVSTDTHGKTESHEHTDAHKKSHVTEHVGARRTSDAEKHAYADAHAKAAHPGIENCLNFEYISYTTGDVRLRFLSEWLQRESRKHLNRGWKTDYSAEFLL